MSRQGAVSRVPIKSEMGRSVRPRVSCTYGDKENFDIFSGNFGENQKKSPLPVGFPRKPLNDITAVLQSLDDESEAGGMKPRKPFTRSQNLGTCCQSYELVETSDIAKKQCKSSNQDKERSKVQFASKAAVKKKSSIPVLVSSLIHIQENRESNTHSLAEKKKKRRFSEKAVSFAEAEISRENANHVVLVPTISSSSNNVTTVEAPCTMVSEGEELHAGVRDEVMMTGEVRVNITQQNQHEVKSDDSPTSCITEASQTVPRTPQQVNPAEEIYAGAPSNRRNEQARGHKKEKTLMTRSSVAKFR